MKLSRIMSLTGMKINEEMDGDDLKAERAIKELSKHLRGLDATMTDLIDLDEMNMMVDEIVNVILDDFELINLDNIRMIVVARL